MVMSSIEFTCPHCGGQLEAWAITDILLKFDISASGKLSEKVIANQGSNFRRAGTSCKSCGWETHTEDIQSDSLNAVVSKVFDKAVSMELCEKKPRNTKP